MVSVLTVTHRRVAAGGLLDRERGTGGTGPQWEYPVGDYSGEERGTPMKKLRDRDAAMPATPIF